MQTNRYARRNRVLAKIGFSGYKEYLASDLWASIKERVFSRDSGLCQVCHQKPAYTVHHVTYSEAVLLGKDISQLMSVCRGCHHHAELKNGRKLLHTSAIAGRTRSRTRGKQAKLRFIPKCVCCGRNFKRLGRDDICMACYKSGRATQWRVQNHETYRELRAASQ